jgi:hypothetical protein
MKAMMFLITLKRSRGLIKKKKCRKMNEEIGTKAR